VDLAVAGGGNNHLSFDRRDVDDGSAARAGNIARDFLRGQPSSFQVHIDNQIPLFFREIGQRSHGDEASAVHESSDST